MFGKKAKLQIAKERKELRSMLDRTREIMERAIVAFEKIDTLKELERMWQERDALEDANERLTAEYDALAAEAKKLADRNWTLEQKMREYEVKANAEPNH